MLTTTESVPTWLHAGIAAAWGWQPDALELTALRHGPHDLLVLASVEDTPTAVIRALRPGRMSLTALESEAAWIRALGEDDVVRVPSVLTTDADLAAAPIDDPTGRRWPALALGFDPVLIGPPPLTVDTASSRRLGALAARLHEHELAWQPPSWFRRPTIELVDLVETAWESAPLPPSALRLLGTAQEAALATVSWAGNAPTGLVHRDLLGSVVRIGEEEYLTEFAECAWTWFEQDFAGSLVGHEPRRDAPSLAAAWVEGYTEVRPWGDPRLACALTMTRRLQNYGRLWSTTGPTPVDPEEAEALAEGTLDIATRYLRSETWLLD
ncbi:phosphotransferase enzyme family protein [Actinotalea sp.]|uniref:phosphotransferase enzyme family protein n=1 Tax=Actinotalea sp. TaxID=1872145 RepID=UPI00356AA63F